MSDLLNIRISDRKILRKLTPYQSRIKIEYYQQENFRIRYVDVGDPERRMVLFIHGAPDSLLAFLRFLKDTRLGKSVRMVAVDRPGYGYSDPGKEVPPVKNQAALLNPLLSLNNNIKKPILVGHSYGGTIAARLAMEYPDQVGGLILVGAAVDPDHEKRFRISSLLGVPRVAKFLPFAILAANYEKINHVKELNEMKSGWKRIRAPVTILHGRKDWIVPVENAYYMERMIAHGEIKMVVKNRLGHLIPIWQPQLIKDEILWMVERY